MTLEIIRQWDLRQDDLAAYFRQTPQSEFAESYLSLLKCILSIVLTDLKFDPGLDDITEIGDGGYSGELIFVFPHVGEEYPPIYFMTWVEYGSCSICDTLLGIRNYDDQIPSERQVSGYMTLCLHMVQKMRHLVGNHTMIDRLIRQFPHQFKLSAYVKAQRKLALTNS